MQSYYLWVLITITLLLQQQKNFTIGRCCGCLEEEREALLALKPSLNFRAGPCLACWDTSKQSNCCVWDGVTCSNTTRRVIKLSLKGTKFPYEMGKFEWYLNASLFLPFKELQTLDLSWNGLSGTLRDEGFERLSALKNLEALSLSMNVLQSGVLPSIFTLKSLKKLNLAGNYLIKGLIHFKDLKNLRRLEYLNLGSIPLNTRIIDYLVDLPMLKHLYLDNCRFIGSISTHGLKRLKSLESLDLNFNLLNETIFGSLGVLPKLKKLSLQQNNIKGLTPSQGLTMLGKRLESLDLSDNVIVDMRALDFLGELSVLKQLDLSLNNLSRTLHNQSVGLCSLKNLEVLILRSSNLGATLPWCLRNMTSLRVLDLSGHRFLDNIASSPIASLTSLEQIILSNVQIQGLVQFSLFANHLKLIKFELTGDDTNELQVETENPLNWAPAFQLTNDTNFLPFSTTKHN